MSHSGVLLLARGAHSAVGTVSVTGRLSEHDPFAQGRRTAFVDDLGIAVGTVQARGSAQVTEYPFTEMLVVHRGCVVLRSQGHTLELTAGHSAVIGRGTPVQVDAQGDCVWAFCTAINATGPNKAGVQFIDQAAALTPSAAPEASMLTGPTPQCRANTLFEDTASPLRIGVWDSTPYARKSRPQPVHELMHVLEGEVVLQADGQPAVTLKAGDTAFVAQGTPCAWASTVYVRKYYAVC